VRPCRHNNSTTTSPYLLPTSSGLAGRRGSRGLILPTSSLCGEGRGGYSGLWTSGRRRCVGLSGSRLSDLPTTVKYTGKQFDNSGKSEIAGNRGSHLSIQFLCCSQKRIERFLRSNSFIDTMKLSLFLLSILFSVASAQRMLKGKYILCLCSDPQVVVHHLSSCHFRVVLVNVASP
jgi:hypothetical protein